MNQPPETREAVAGRQKNLRLLGQQESAGSQPSLAETIAALQEELAKGEAVYTREELAYLGRKRAEAEGLLRALTHGG